MNKIILPTILITSSLVFSACTKGNGTALSTQESNQAPAPIAIKEDAQESGFSGSIKDLMGIEKSQKCTWTTADEGEGVVYVAGDKSRSEFKMPAVDGQPAQQLLNISDGEWTYSWNPITNEGMKIKLEDKAMDDSMMADDEEMMADDENMMVDEVQNDEYEFQCEAWSADQNMFIPPADVKFTDMNAMVEQAQQGSQGMKQVCNMLTGEEQAECLKSFEQQ